MPPAKVDDWQDCQPGQAIWLESAPKWHGSPAVSLPRGALLLPWRPPSTPVSSSHLTQPRVTCPWCLAWLYFARVPIRSKMQKNSKSESSALSAAWWKSRPKAKSVRTMNGKMIPAGHRWGLQEFAQLPQGLQARSSRVDRLEQPPSIDEYNELEFPTGLLGSRAFSIPFPSRLLSR